jgi:2-oxoglutarate ferredoxin oxidoreductase subunit beta
VIGLADITHQVYKTTYRWYRDRVYKLKEQEYDPSDKMNAFIKEQEWGDRIPIGIVY